jgi:hypothetical protein
MGTRNKDGVFIPDFIQIPTLVLMDKELEPNDFLTYGAVYWYYQLNDSANDRVCNASNERLGKIVGLSGGSVCNSLTNLERCGYIERIYKDKAKRHRTEIVPLVVYAKISGTTKGLIQYHQRVDLVPPIGGQKDNRKDNKNGDTVEAFASNQSLGGGDKKLGIEEPTAALDATVPVKKSAIVAPGGGRRLSDEPYEIKTPLQKVVCAWKEITGFDPTDRTWDQAHWGRHAKTAAGLMAFLGNHIAAIDCCQSIYEGMTKKGLSCTIETVLKHSADWKLKQQGGHDGKSDY